MPCVDDILTSFVSFFLKKRRTNRYLSGKCRQRFGTQKRGAANSSSYKERGRGMLRKMPNKPLECATNRVMEGDVNLAFFSVKTDYYRLVGSPSRPGERG